MTIINQNNSQVEGNVDLRQKRLCPFAQSIHNIGVNFDIGLVIIIIKSITGQ